MDSHVKDKTVLWLSYLKMGIPIPGKDSLYYIEMGIWPYMASLDDCSYPGTGRTENNTWDNVK